MKQTETIIEQLRQFGLSVSQTAIPNDVPDGGIIQNDGATVFTVPYGGKTYAFAIDGNGEQQRVAAALAREYAIGAYSKLSSADEQLRDFLNGTGDAPIGVHVGKFDYFVFALYCKAAHKTVREYVRTMASEDDVVADMSDGITAFCKRVDNDSDYQSAGEFAAVLRENLGEEIKENIKIGVGGIARGTAELPLYYVYAKSALVSGAEFDPSSDIYSYKEYALIKSLSELSDTAKEKYVKTVLDKNYRSVLEDVELMSAADAFFKHSLNISEASRSMYVHRNTLIYRLDKIEKLTGLNIRNFNDAMTFRVACLLNKIIND